VRIIAGIAGGLRIESPATDRVRPTADRVREAWFSSMQTRLPGAHVLDVFAGSGALGLEAASRGAAEVVCVERDRRTVDLIRRNAATTGLDVEVVLGDAATVITSALPAAPFDIVLLDPPYRIEHDELAPVLSAIAEVVRPGGEVWVEMARRAGPPPWPATLRHERTRRYGETELHTAVHQGDQQ